MNFYVCTSDSIKAERTVQGQKNGAKDAAGTKCQFQLSGD